MLNFVILAGRVLKIWHAQKSVTNGRTKAKQYAPSRPLEIGGGGGGGREGGAGGTNINNRNIPREKLPKLLANSGDTIITILRHLT